MVIDVTDPDSIVQCVGRKRFVNESDSLRLYIRGRSGQQLGGILRRCKEEAKNVKYFQNKGAVAYNAKFDRRNDQSGLIVDTPTEDGAGPRFTKKVNLPMYCGLLYRIEMYDEMIHRADGYCGYVAERLGIKDYVVLENEVRQKTLAEYLDSIAGKPMLTHSEREPFIEKLDIRRNNRLCRTYKTLAAWLEDSELPYRLHEYRTSRIIGGKKQSFRAWEIVRLDSAKSLPPKLV